MSVSVLGSRHNTNFRLSLVGAIDSTLPNRLVSNTMSPPPFSLASHSLASTEAPSTNGTIDILGGGIAGACVLRALAVALSRQGAMGHVTLRLIDTSPPASGASAAPMALFHPLLSRDHNLASQLVWQGIQTTHHWLTQLGGYAEGWAALTGAVETFTPPDHQGMEALVRHPDLAGGVSMASPTAVRSLLAGWAAMPRLVQACIADAQRRLGPQRVRLLAPAPRVLAEGLLQGADGGTAGASHVVVATAHGEGLPEAVRAHLALAPLGGQLSWINTKAVLGASAQALPPLNEIRCGQGYAVHAGGVLYAGASFHRDPLAPGGLATTTADHRQNLHRLAELAPAWADALAPHWETHGHSWAAIRWTTRDRLPHVGAVACPEARLTPQMSQPQHLPRMAGVSVLLGLGSRGLSLAPLAAEALAARILGLPQPLPLKLVHATDPARFVLRTHRRAN